MQYELSSQELAEAALEYLSKRADLQPGDVVRAVFEFDNTYMAHGAEWGFTIREEDVDD